MRRLIFAFALLLGAIPALAADFRSAAGPVTILYDAPSTEAKPLFVINRGYPLEILVNLSEWAKVRDSSGAMAWAQQSQLSPLRTVVVRVESDILTQPQDHAPVNAHVAAGVILFWLQNLAGNWAKVRLPDQSVGYIKLDRIWGT
ncbi:MAG: SH3 domain-containing protein [Sulfuriferula sp.]